MRLEDAMNKLYAKGARSNLKSSINCYMNKHCDVINSVESKKSKAINIRSSNNQSLMKYYSKPYLKVKYKFPAISLSNIKVRPDPLKQRAKNTELFQTTYENSLKGKIQTELEGINTIINNDWKSNTLSELKAENSVLKKQLVAIKELMNELMRHKTYKYYSLEMNKEQEITKQRVEEIKRSVKEKQLIAFQLEYEKLCNKVQVLKDPLYRERLEKNCKQVDIEIENIRKHIKKLTIKSKVTDYVSYSI